MLKQIISGAFLLFAANVRAEAEGNGCVECVRGRRGKRGPMGRPGPVGPTGRNGTQGADGMPGDSPNGLSFNFFRTEAYPIKSGDIVQFSDFGYFPSAGFIPYDQDGGTAIGFLANGTYVVTYTIDAESDGPLYFQLELNGQYVPGSRYGVNPAAQQIVGRALIEVPDRFMNLTLKCVEGNATFISVNDVQNNGSLSVIFQGFDPLSS